jgi:parvulin-like peptidyl-prolyl isomerase
MKILVSIVAGLLIGTLSQAFAADAKKGTSAPKKNVIETNESAIDPNAVVIIVNDKKLTEGQLVEILAPRMKQINGKPAEDMIPKYKQQMRSQAIEQFIIETMLAEKEKAQKITVSEAEIAAAINEQASQQNLSLDKFKSVLKSYGIEYCEYQEDMKKRLAFEKLMEKEFIGKIKKPTDKEIKTYYGENIQQFTKDSSIISFENAKERIITALNNRQKNKIVTNYIQNLKANAKVKLSNEVDKFGINISK